MNFATRFLCALAGAFFLCAGTAFGQHQVAGTVTDSTDSAILPGVNIVVKGTTTGTTTGVNGTYQLTAPSSSDTLVFSFVGYESTEVPIRGRDEINVSLRSSTIVGEELVVVGYGTQQRADITGSVSVADVEELKKSSETSIAGALEGQIAGVSVQTSGAPGENPAIRIRGIGTFGGTSPLYVVDGVPVDNIIDFSINNIESVQVMKDAAASAIYGSRAANGVVIIETSSGQAGGLQVSYNASVGTERVHQRIDVLGREQFQEFNNLIRANAGLAPAPANDSDSPAYVDDINTNWQEAALDRGISTEHNLTVSGGNETSTFSISAGLSSQEGHMQGPAPYYERYTARINSTHELGRLTLGENLSLTHSENNPQTSRWENSLFSEVIKTPPTIRFYEEAFTDVDVRSRFTAVAANVSLQSGPSNASNFALNGDGSFDYENNGTLGADSFTYVLNDGLGGTSAATATINVVGANNLLEREQDVNRVLANLWGELQILDDLNYKLNLSYDTRGYHEKFFTPTYDLGFFYQEPDGQLDEIRNELVTTIIENTLTYAPTFGNHDFNIVAGYSEERSSFSENFARGVGYSRPFFKVIDAAESDQANGFRSESALRSFFGRVQYNFDDRYLLTATIRRDGSSRFGENNRYGNYPSVSVGWRVSEESFFNVAWVDDLKLRGSWGQLGRQNIGDFATATFINTNANYNFSDQLADGAIQVNLANPNLKWETQVSRTLGIDATLFGNTLDVTAEYFRNESQDILVGIPIPGSLGAAENPEVNAATIENSGFEFAVGYNNAVGDLIYNLSTNISTLHNEVLSLGNGEPIPGAASWTAVGSEVGEIYGYVTDGIFQSQEEVNDHATQEPGTAPGDIRFRDLDGNGIIDAEDRTYLGSPTPDFTYGFTANLQYNSWDATVFVQGNYGNKIYNNTRLYVENVRDYNNSSVRIYENHWSPDNRHNDVRFPRPVYNDPNENIRASDRWVEDGSYMRLKNVAIGYTLPQRLIGRVGMDNLRVYVSGQNLLTLTGYSGLDPELGTNSGDGGNNNIANDGLFSRGYADAAWPHPRRFTTGVQVTF